MYYNITIAYHDAPDEELDVIFCEFDSAHPLDDDGEIYFFGMSRAQAIKTIGDPDAHCEWVVKEVGGYVEFTSDVVAKAKATAHLEPTDEGLKLTFADIEFKQRFGFYSEAAAFIEGLANGTIDRSGNGI